MRRRKRVQHTDTEFVNALRAVLGLAPLPRPHEEPKIEPRRVYAEPVPHEFWRHAERQFVTWG